MKNFLSPAIIVVFIAVLIPLLSHQPTHHPSDSNYLNIGGEKLEIIIAQTPDDRERGLSGRPELKENEGMLFIFEQPDIYYFWMKEMNFPIDMIWLDENKNIIYIEKNATPESYPQTFGPNQNSLYVLEVVAGFSDKHNLKVGDKVEF